MQTLTLLLMGLWLLRCVRVHVRVYALLSHELTNTHSRAYTTLTFPLQYRNSGQTCVCTNRMIVHKDVIDEFTTKLAKKVEALRVGPGRDPRTVQVCYARLCYTAVHLHIVRHYLTIHAGSADQPGRN